MQNAQSGLVKKVNFRTKKKYQLHLVFNQHRHRRPDLEFDRRRTGGFDSSRHSQRKSPTILKNINMSEDYTPALFLDAQDKSDEARTKFSEIHECTYLAKHLGNTGQKETMTCDCSEDWDEGLAQNLACGEHSNCINRVTSVECNNRLSTCGKNCQNQRFQNRQYCDVKVIQTEKKGYGLVAQGKITEGLFIYEYIGEVIDEASFRARMVDYDQRKLRHFYFMMLTKDAFIDATDRGSLARFCNHSCSPNAYVDKWVVGEKLRMGIFAKRPIAQGEEITFDYNVDRYGAQLQPCYCGSPNCLGWMGGKTQTDAALLLPDGISDALGVTRAQERAWLKQNKLSRKQSPESVVNEEFVKNLEVEPLGEADVTKAMSALMKVEDSAIVAKLVERMFLTDEPKTNSLIVRLHGYKTLSLVLREHGENDADLTFKILLVLKRWPSVTRNKIELSQIEDVVKGILTLANAEIHDLAGGLLAEWSKLEMAYRIPKHVEAVETARGSISPLLGRNPRSELPIRSALIDTDETAAVDLVDDEDLPEGWQKALDQKSDTVYYYHTGLGISKWDRPTAAVPRGPKAPKAPAKQAKPVRPQRKFEDNDMTRAQEERLQKQKEDQFNEVRQKEKLLQELIVQSQRDAEEKKRLAEQVKQEKFEKHKERKRRKEAAIARAKAPAVSASPEALWTKTLAKHIPNMIKKHEAEIGHENVKGCARELVKLLAGKEARKDPSGKPPHELDTAKLKKLKEFTKGFMDKFLAKYRAKRAKHDNGEPPSEVSEATTVP